MGTSRKAAFYEATSNGVKGESPGTMQDIVREGLFRLRFCFAPREAKSSLRMIAF